MSDTFKILTDAEHVRERLGMYAGSAVSEPITGLFFGKRQTLEVVPALLKIISEILDNSIDEAIRTKFEFANKIDVSIAKKDNGLEGDVWEVSVQDNGRGIPVEKIGNTDMYRPVIAWTQARAGSNFTAERETIGANGVGSFLTNVLSTSFVGETSDGTTYLKMVCNGMANVKNVTTTKSSKRFTRVTFTPDLSVFGLTDISSDHLDFIRDRLDNLAACYPEVTFTFNGDKIKFKDSKEYAARYCQHYVIAKDTNNLLVFGPSGKEEEFLLHSYVNGLWVRNGGTHVNFIMDKVIETLRSHILKKHKIEVLPNAIRQHMTLVTVFRGFQNLKFDSQTKERITNTYSEISSQLSGFDFDKIAKNILNTPEIIDPMIQAILYKKELEERRELEKKKKLASKKRVVSHIAASSNNPDEKILFIAEGLSAVGQLLNVRDAKLHGGYPLRGKIMNVRDERPLDIMKNKVISELLTVIGLEIGSKPDSLNYGTIGIMTDADTDGSHIFSLLLNLFSLWPELFEQGRICRVMTPLYVCTKGKDEKWFYTQEEYAAAADSLVGYNVEYCKGLGSLTKEVYRKCVNEPVLVRVKGDLDILDMAFGNSADARKEWMMK